jgi:hypothetical protein
MNGNSSILDRSKYAENISLILEENFAHSNNETYQTSGAGGQIKSSALKHDLFQETLQHRDLLNVSSLVDPHHNQNVKKIGIDPNIYCGDIHKKFLAEIGLNKSIDREKQKIKVEKSLRPRLIATQRLNDFGNDDVNNDYDDYSEFFEKGREEARVVAGLDPKVVEINESGYEKYLREMCHNADEIKHKFDVDFEELAEDDKKNKKLSKKREFQDLVQRREAIEGRLRMALSEGNSGSGGVYTKEEGFTVCVDS